MSRTTRLRRRRSTIALASLVLVGLLSFVAIGVASGASTGLTAAQQQPVQASTFAASKYANGSVAKTDPSLLGRTDSKLVPVMIKYALTPTASYAGGIKGLKATSPRMTHKAFAKNVMAFSRYQRFAEAKVKRITFGSSARCTEPRSAQRSPSPTAALPPACRPTRSASCFAVPGVVAVQKDTLNQPQDDNTSFIGATSVWPTLGGQDNAGSNVVIGMIDTGIWPESPYFVDRGLPAPPHPRPSRAASSVTARTSRISARRSPATTS